MPFVHIAAGDPAIPQSSQPAAADIEAESAAAQQAQAEIDESVSAAAVDAALKAKMDRMNSKKIKRGKVCVYACDLCVCGYSAMLEISHGVYDCYNLTEPLKTCKQR